MPNLAPLRRILGERGPRMSRSTKPAPRKDYPVFRLTLPPSGRPPSRLRKRGELRRRPILENRATFRHKQVTIGPFRVRLRRPRKLRSSSPTATVLLLAPSSGPVQPAQIHGPVPENEEIQK